MVSGAAASGRSSGVTYTYNGDGLRMQSKNGSATDFSWDPLSNPATPHILTDGTNAYIYGPDVFSGESAPIEQISLGESPTISNLNSDPMGVRQIFNLGGSIQIVYSYNGSSIGAYGNYSTTSYWGGISTPFRYKGGYEDSYYQEYFVNRYYDLYSGQFLSVDPLVAQTNQPYTYTNDDPINAGDPTGMQCESDETPPSTPTGVRGSPMTVPVGAYADTEINGITYTGHAIGEMQSEGFMPSVVEDTIENGVSTVGASGRVAYYNAANNLTVISEDGKIITVTSGSVKVR